MSKSPLVAVNDDFGGKDKLVDKLVGILPTGEEPKDDLRKRLLGVSNKKLLRLHRVATTLKDKYGSREKLIAGAATGREKDKDFVTRLEGLPTAQLVDIAGATERRARRAGAPKGADKVRRAPVEKKAAAKTAAPEKSAAAKKSAAKKAAGKRAAKKR